MLNQILNKISSILLISTSVQSTYFGAASPMRGYRRRAMINYGILIEINCLPNGKPLQT